MSFDRFQGDPRLTLDENGADLIFQGGQPVMDQGLENLALISLFTSLGWVGNTLITDPDSQVGSDFYDNASGTLTVSQLNNIRQAAIKALDNEAFGDVTVTVTNPNGKRVNVKILIEPPGSDSQEIILTRNRLNWVQQKNYPAYERI